MTPSDSKLLKREHASSYENVNNIFQCIILEAAKFLLSACSQRRGLLTPITWKQIKQDTFALVLEPDLSIINQYNQ